MALHGPEHLPAWLVYSYAVIDLPFSAAFETLLLPYDLWREHSDTNYWHEVRSFNPPPLWQRITPTEPP